jgi:hypothetical protein
VTRESGPWAEPDPEDEQDLEDVGVLRPLTAGAVTTWAVVGLVAGWALHPLSEAFRGTPVIVSWVQPVALVMLTAMVAITAWHTWESVRGRRERLEPYRAVNRLVLGRTAALVGALVAGGYVGYLVSWLGSESDQAGLLMLRSGVAAGTAVLLTASGVALERACRVPKPPTQA